MTSDPRPQAGGPAPVPRPRTGLHGHGLGPLGRRLFAAFALVALVSVALLTAAALVGADRGVSSAHQAERQRTADRVAAVAADAYRTAGGWPGADLSRARSLAAGAGADLTVWDADGGLVLGTPGPGRAHGGQGGAPGPVATAEVSVDGAAVGSVRLRFASGTGTAGRSVAWGWVGAAAVGALALALAASWFVTRRLTAPVVRVADTARALASGDRAARARVDAPGELGYLARAFDAMADDVTSAERARHRLAADVAHELRTPLAALQAGLEELRDGYAQASPERLAALHDQALRLGRIVGDLGELADAESARLSLHPAEVDLVALVRSALAGREAELRTAGLTVHSRLGTAPVPVPADADRLHQALGNLLSNAARHCRPGDSVTVTVSATPAEARIEVADTGPGIPADELPYVFDRLWRGTRARATGGSGIGLAVVKELVTAHGGSVTAEPSPGGGTRMTVRLPRTTRAGTRRDGPGQGPAETA
ncbi:sensor histidine kinase [Streptomyces caeni]|uniref:histidine kinase n=1 Tax=Streptomyces caeni TaxID=2307231 RepID=A0ABW4IXS1_9ACTN